MTGRRASQPRGFCSAVCCALPIGPAVDYECKFELYIFGLVFLKKTFLVVVSHSTLAPGGRENVLFNCCPGSVDM
jgi:hypothetical protein